MPKNVFVTFFGTKNVNQEGGIMEEFTFSGGEETQLFPEHLEETPPLNQTKNAFDV